MDAGLDTDEEISDATEDEVDVELSDELLLTQIPPQSAPPFFGSQESDGSSLHVKPVGQAMAAMPPQNCALAEEEAVRSRTVISSARSRRIPA